MTLEDWLASLSVPEVRFQLRWLSDRKLHLLAAAFLRRVWDGLSCDHTRTAVEATEAFADGCITARELARLRSTDFLESGEGLWLGEGDYQHEEQLMGMGCRDCPGCDQAADEYVCQAARDGQSLDGVRAAVEDPAWMAVRAAWHAREVAAWKALPDDRAAAESDEASAQFELLREIGGPCADPRWPRWRTTDVVALARGIHRDGAFDRLPILADALQDAGCDDIDVLQHCRAAGGGSGEPAGGSLVPVGHVRGCWVVDLAMGYG